MIRQLLALALAGSPAACSAFPALAHSWYDPECCHQMDCAPVLRTEQVAGWTYAGAVEMKPQLPSTYLTTEHGRGVVHQQTKLKESKDGKAHACIVAGGVRCWYLPPGI